MITVSTLELFKRSAEILNEGFEKVEIDILEADDDLPACITFSGADNDAIFDNQDFDEIEEYNDANYSEFQSKSSEPAPFVSTFDELFLIHKMCSYAKQHCLHTLDDKSLSAEDRSSVMNDLKNINAYNNCLTNYLKNFESNN